MNVRAARQASGIPTLDIDLYTPDILPDPWPVLARIREAGPLVWNERGYWMTARDSVCREIFNMPGIVGQEGLISALFGKEAFISIDDKKAHNALRNVWADTFRMNAVAALAAFVKQVADKMLDEVEPQLQRGATVEMVSALCRPLPAYVIAHLIGVGDDMIPSVIRWSDLMADATSSGFPIDYEHDPAWLASERAKEELGAFLIEQFHYRRRCPGEDLISKLVHSGIGATLSDEALMVNTRMLLFAGNETTAKWLANILLTFHQRAEIRRAVNEDRSLLAGTLEEIMRWQGVAQTLQRGVVVDHAVVSGIELAKGDEVLMLLGAANRDPERYERPDELDIHRKPKAHLGFGIGLHNCLGAILARLEVLQVTSAVLDRFPEFSIVEPVSYGLFSVRGPNALPFLLSNV